MNTRVAEVFKIGIGPSSSHTVGPMRAARAFIISLSSRLADVTRVEVGLYGSLALTGKGHGTDRAVVLGLAGHQPDTVDPQVALDVVETAAANGRLELEPGRSIAFDPATDIIFHSSLTLAQHSNGMRFRAFDTTARLLAERDYFSIGGGAVEGEGFESIALTSDIPYRFDSAAELLALAELHGLALWQVVEANELALGSPAELHDYLARIWQTMQSCAQRGLHTEGILPGGLNVRRRAPRLYAKYRAQAHGDTLAAMDFVNVIAIAVNEENAAGGRVVTAPTNGAAG